VFESGSDTFANAGSFAFYRDGNFKLASWGHGDVSNNERLSAASLSGGSNFGLATGVVDFGMNRHETYTYLNGDASGTLNTAIVNQANNFGTFANLVGNIGSRNNGASLALGGDIAELMIYTGRHNASQRKTIEDYLAAKWGLSRRVISANIMFEGDSMTEGGDNHFAECYPQQLVNRLTDGVHYWNPSVSGQTVAQMQLDASTQIYPLSATAFGNKNVCVFWGGTNDLRFGADMSTTLNRITSYSAALRTAGYKVLLVTMLPRSDVGTPPTFNADRLAINASLRANWTSYADGLIDIALDGRIGDAGDELIGTYWDTDRVHLIGAGLSIIADYVESALGSRGIT
jgi:hypothetical protein